MDASRRQRIEDICDQALALDHNQRAAYLDRLCGTDRELRRDVESLLAHGGTAARLLTGDVAALAARTLQSHDIIGRRFGDYEITGKLGEGGMGEVYRARDRKLGRDVAIKILPAVFASDHERMRRFEREAQLLATVNHRFIGHIYGAIEIDGGPALVLELVDGETLSARLDKGALSVTRALTIATQIAEALDHAHRRRITHRDLKPSNIMLTRDGTKLLDFGVGKRTLPASHDTMSRPSTLTGEGAIVGTLHYMSPEQLENRDVDERSDLFSFGAVLFEMLSGRKAFDGPSQASIIAAMIEAPRPRLSGVGGQYAARLDRILGKCLEKDPDERWQTARDLGDELQWLLDDLSPAANAPENTASTRGNRSWWTAAAAMLAAAALGWASWTARDWTRPVRETAPVRLEISPPPGMTILRGFDISPDGTQIAYADTFQTTPTTVGRGLWIRRFDQFESHLIPNIEGASAPRFSPDGQWLLFWVGTTLRKVRTDANEPSRVVAEDVRDFHSLEWGAPNTVVIGVAGRPLRRLSADGGDAVDLQSTGDGIIDLHSPHPLPDGRHMLVAIHRPNNEFSIAVQEVDGANRRTLIDGFQPNYLPSGILVFARANTILAAPFDSERLEITGPAVPVVEGVTGNPRSGEANFRLSSSGAIAYVPQRPRGGRTFVWMSTRGERASTGIPAGAVDTPKVSPDGLQVAYSLELPNGSRQIWTHEFATGRRVAITRTDEDCGEPLWTHDGGLVFSKLTPAGSDLFLQSKNGDSIKLASSTNRLLPLALLRDGRTLIVNEQPPTDRFFFSQVDLLRPGTLTGFRIDPNSDPSLDTREPRNGSISPDGTLFSFVAPQGDRVHSFIQALPPVAAPRQVSVESGLNPVWSKDGKTLYFRSFGRLYGVSIDTSHGLTWSAPRLLFESDMVSSRDYDSSPDGRLLMIARDPQETAPARFDVVLNWLTELRSRVPAPR